MRPIRFHARPAVLALLLASAFVTAPPAAAQCIAGSSPGFDFAPGARLLFATDFSQDKLGDFPAGLEFKTGAMEVSLWDGKPALKASAPSALLIPLAETLPDQFTVEVGVVNRNTKQVGAHTLKIYGGRIPLSDFATGATRVNVGTVFWEVTGGATKAEAPMPEGTDDTCVGQFMNIRLSVDGPKLKVYADDKRIASIPNAQFLRAKGLMIALEGRDDESNAVYVTSIRVAGGSPSGGNTVAAQSGPTATVPPVTTATAPPGRTATLPPGTVASTPPRPTSSSPTTATTTATPTAPRTDPARDSMISAASAPPPATAPAVAATGLVANTGVGTVRLAWQPAPNAVGYRIARLKASGGGTVTLTGEIVQPDGTGLLTKPEYLDTQVEPNQQYLYTLGTYFRDAGGNYYFPESSTEQRATVTARGGVASLTEKSLQPGDLLLYVGVTPIMSAAIIEFEKIQLGPPPEGRPMYSHAGIYLGNESGVEMVAEMLKDGYVKRPMQQSVDDDNLRVDVYRRTGITIEQQYQVAQNAWLLRPSLIPYGWDQLGVLTQIVINPLTQVVQAAAALADVLSGGTRAMICSEMVRWAYYNTGIDPQIMPWPKMTQHGILGTVNRQMDYTTPNMLARSPSFVLVYSLK